MQKLFKEIPPELLTQYSKVRENEVFVIKVGGEIFENKFEEQFDKLIDAISFLVQNKIKVVLVHGAGPQVSAILKEKDRSGNRITPPENIDEIEKNSERISKQVAAKFEGNESVVVPPPYIQSEKVANDNLTANIGKISAVLPSMIDKHEVVIIGHTGVDTQSGLNTNINADAVAAEMAITVGANKLFFLTNTNGVLDANQETIGEMNPNEIDPSDKIFQGGMVPKIEKAKKVALHGIPTHLVSWKHPGNIVREALTPEGVPEQATKISLEKTKPQWKKLEQNSPLIDQLVVLIKNDTNLLPRDKEKILAEIDSWNLLVEDRVIKGAFQTKPQNEHTLEIGGVIIPAHLQKNKIGDQIIDKFECIRNELRYLHGCAVVSDKNTKGLRFFNNTFPKSQSKTFPKDFNKNREIKGKTYFQWI